VFRTYKYRLYPTKAQARSLAFLLWQGRNLYNAALEQRITTHEESGKGVKYAAQWNHFRDLRHDNPDTLGQLNATSVQQMLRRLDKAFVAFFRRAKAGETAGFPRFKKEGIVLRALSTDTVMAASCTGGRNRMVRSA